MFFDDLEDANRDRVEKFRCVHTLFITLSTAYKPALDPPPTTVPPPPVTSIDVLV